MRITKLDARVGSIVISDIAHGYDAGMEFGLSLLLISRGYSDIYRQCAVYDMHTLSCFDYIYMCKSYLLLHTIFILTSVYIPWH